MDVQWHLPMHINYKNKIVHTKFYVIDDLPYEYLIGRSLINLLGYKLMRRNETFVHKSIPEFYDAEFDDFSGEMYPLSTDTFEIDLDQLHCKTDKGRGKLIEMLEKYAANLSMHSNDYGSLVSDKIKPATIDIRDDIPVIPISNRPYIINNKYFDKVTEIIADLKDSGKIDYSNSNREL